MTSYAVLPVLQERSAKFLGASEAAGVLGLDRYNPPIKIWRRHRGLDVEDTMPAYVSEAIEWGHLHEPIVRGKYALMTRSVVEVPTKSTTRDGWLRATPDGIVFDFGRSRDPGCHSDDILPGPVEDRQGLVQCKTADSYFDHEWTAGPPPRYEVQVRVEMAVMNLPWCDVICLVGGNRLRGPFRIERDPIIEARILADLRSFWELVQSGEEPTVDHSDAWRLHVSEQMKPTKASIRANQELHGMLSDLRAARVARAAASERVDRATTSVMLKMSAVDAQIIEDSRYGRFSAYRAGAGMDWKGYALALEGSIKHATDIPDRDSFSRPSTKWALRVPRGFTAEDDNE